MISIVSAAYDLSLVFGGCYFRIYIQQEIRIYNRMHNSSEANREKNSRVAERKKYVHWIGKCLFSYRSHCTLKMSVTFITFDQNSYRTLCSVLNALYFSSHLTICSYLACSKLFCKKKWYHGNDETINMHPHGLTEQRIRKRNIFFFFTPVWY